MSGYIYIPKELHEALIRAVLDSLAEQGFYKIVVWRGCGGHDPATTVEAFNSAHKGKCKAYLLELPYHTRFGAAWEIPPCPAATQTVFQRRLPSICALNLCEGSASRSRRRLQ